MNEVLKEDTIGKEKRKFIETKDKEKWDIIETKEKEELGLALELAI